MDVCHIVTVTSIRAGRPDMTTSMPSWNNDPLATGPTVADELPGLEAERSLTSPDYESFFRASYADVVRHLVRRGLDAETAADCAQEAYIRAYARWWRIRRYEDPAGWVRRVATNLAIDHHRKADRQRRLLPTLFAARSHSAPAPPDPDRLGAISASLTPQQRRVVELCYGQDLSTEQAADRLGISAGAVRFHLTRARARLRPTVAQERAAEEAR